MKENNHKRWKSGLLAVLTALVVCIALIPAQSADAATIKINLSGYNTVPTLDYGQSYGIKGTITCDVNISRVEVGVVSDKTKGWVSGAKYDNKSVNAKTFDLTKADASVKFGSLAAGKYYYRIWVHPKGGAAKMLLNQSFTVNKSVAADLKLSGNNTVPDLTVGLGCDLTGTITSKAIINRVEIGVVSDKTKDWVSTAKYDNKKVNAKTFDLSKANPYIQFSSLPAGTYYYRIWVHPAGNAAKKMVDQKFTVKSAQDARIVLSDSAKIEDFTEGEDASVSGMITSDVTLSRVEIGVVSAKTGDWVSTAKYDNKAVNSLRFDVSTADASINFAKLPAGTYYYRIWAHPAGQSAQRLANQKFTVLEIPASITLTGNNTVPKLETGSDYKLKGTITSDVTLSRVEIGVVSAETKNWVDKAKYDNKAVNAKTFDISTATSSIKFSSLPAGTYYYRIWAHPSGKSAQMLLDQEFTVVDTSTAVSTVALRNYANVPNLTEGTEHQMTGTIVSDRVIKRVEIGVVDASTRGWLKTHKYDNIAVNDTTFDVAAANDSIDFSTLQEGGYYYRIYAHLEDGTVKVMANQYFTVKAKTEALGGDQTGTAQGGDEGDPDEEAGSADEPADPEKPSVTIEVNTIPDLQKGSSCNISGTITSNTDISRVEIGVVSKSTKKWCDNAKYDNAEVNAKTFDISAADSSIKFGALISGTYYFRVYAHTADGTVHTLANQEFEVIGLGANEEAINAACDWAVMIANDNSFTYGVGDRAHRFGCYFCDTNIRKKGAELVDGHSYEKTYCCNPFVHAAFAHGAGDAGMLADCQKGTGVTMKESSYTKYGTWVNAGKPSYSNLQRGDVLVKSNHVVLYIGNGQIVHAAGEGWGDGSIKVQDLSTSYYSTFSFVMRYTGTGKF